MAKKEYIEREKLGIGRCNPEIFEDKGYAKGWNAAIDFIQSAPAADVRPVVRGKWEYTAIEGDAIPEILTVVKGVCSICHNYSEEMPKWIYDDGGRIWFNFCPNCGADMREEI